MTKVLMFVILIVIAMSHEKQKIKRHDNFALATFFSNRTLIKYSTIRQSKNYSSVSYINMYLKKTVKPIIKNVFPRIFQACPTKRLHAIAKIKKGCVISYFKKRSIIRIPPSKTPKPKWRSTKSTMSTPTTLPSTIKTMTTNLVTTTSKKPEISSVTTKQITSTTRKLVLLGRASIIKKEITTSTTLEWVFIVPDAEVKEETDRHIETTTAKKVVPLIKSSANKRRSKKVIEKNVTSGWVFILPYPEVKDAAGNHIKPKKMLPEETKLKKKSPSNRKLSLENCKDIINKTTTSGWFFVLPYPEVKDTAGKQIKPKEYKSQTMM